MERRKADRYFSDEISKFKIRAKIDEIGVNGFVYDISELGVGIAAQIQDVNKILTGSAISGFVLSPDERKKFHFEGSIVRKEFILQGEVERLLVGVKFSVKIALPDYLTVLALPVGFMVD
ncbi:hypothetical protein LEP1GSC047_2094 [Leptospira inadai serovar Lyme str. 10]|uniref:PilZ domain-containing protein n=2 Tax=Leptospira inadai serovar Lyme TaxID=293084 RepID=V6HZV1_9LEPT|nr:PilZ domain-containing protein [Leptospira inadai]EQA38539.1 hypothetical protein LEP1GSC047_2094 [Leptospira inadai serovar Lyme str. 10]PNV71531.1 PilZ domain-containing protein [Leptospira inadai serovar Lyme]